MKRLNNLALIFLIQWCSFSVACWADARSSLFGPDDPPSSELLNVKLNSNDLPSGAEFRSKLTLRDPKFAGWFKSANTSNWADFNPGLVESWKVGNLYFSFHYGFFPTESEAQFAVGPAIEAALGAEADPVTKQNSTSFNGQLLGEVTYSWHSDMEKQYGKFNKGPHGQPFPSEYAGIAFSKGKFGTSVHAGIEIANGHIDKNLMEVFAQKILNKINVGNSLRSLDLDLARLITHQGILRSLQVKLDQFIKNFREGDYKTALNVMNAFTNELVAQRVKHVSESAYQTLKGYVDTIIQSLNSLM